jgi:tRNA dimethylallyltransferase
MAGDRDAHLWILTGPSASGKSALALAIAERVGAEILSMDSMAVYRRMNVGTAKPSASERERVPHFGLDLVEPWEPFDTARYLECAEAAIAAIHGRGRKVLVVGGTPLYLMALRKGLFTGPRADRALRAELLDTESATPGTLHQLLAQVDPPAAARIHRNDHKRLVRALEVFTLTGAPLTEQQAQFEASSDRWPNTTVAVAWPRAELHQRIKARAHTMFARGLMDEVRDIQAAGGFSRQAAQAIGYRQCLQFLGGELTAEQLPDKVAQATRQLVRKQETWFRRMGNMVRCAPALDDVLRAFAAAT